MFTKFAGVWHMQLNRFIWICLAVLFSAGPAWAQSVPTTINVANAPRYSNGAPITQGNAATHTLASRIIGGPGCTKTGFTNGQNCWLWQALNAGTLGSNDTNTWTCATPANTGGIYATSFPGATTQTDSNGGSSVTLACLTKIDYVTLTQAFNDATVDWVTGTAYYGGEYVRNQGAVYRNDMDTLGLGGSGYQCTSGASMPAPPGFSGAISDGGCTFWTEQSSDTYSSLAAGWQHELWLSGQSQGGGGPAAVTVQQAAPVTVYVWHGGHEAPVYTPGINNEGGLIMYWRHYSRPDDNPIICSGSPPGGTCYSSTLTVPPGDSFVDNVSPSTGIVGIVGSDYGVYLKGVAQWPLGGPCCTYQTGGEPIAWSDNAVTVTRLQIKSLFGMVMNASHVSGPADAGLTNARLSQNIWDSGGGFSAMKCDAACMVNASLVINRSLLPGAGGYHSTYQSLMYNSTFLGVGGTNSFGIGADNSIGSPPGTEFFYNNLILGYAYPFAYGVNSPQSGSNNATDVSAACCTSTTFMTADGNGPMHATQIVGTSINSLTASNELVQPAVQPNAQVSSTQACNPGGSCGYFLSGPITLNFTTEAANSCEIIMVQHNGTTITGVTTPGLTWTARATNVAAGGLDIWYANVANAGTYTATISYAGTAGFTTTSALSVLGAYPCTWDSNPGLPAVVNTGAAPTFSTSNANDLWVSYFNCSNTFYDQTPSPGWMTFIAGGYAVIAQYQEAADTASSVSVPVPSQCTSGGGVVDALIAHPIASDINARVKSATAQIYNAGTHSMAGILISPTNDILGQSRATRVDIGAVNFGGSPPPSPGVGGGRSFFH